MLNLEKPNIAINQYFEVVYGHAEDFLNNVRNKKLFVAFQWVVTSTGPGGFMICVFII